MPSTTIEVLRTYTRDEEVAIIEAVHAALVEGIKIPEADRTVRLLVHEPHRFAIPPDRDDRYTMISIDLFHGRSLDARRNLYQAIVRNLEPLGIPPDHVKIVLREIAAENWGVRGGKPASEVEIGFKIDV
jgi:phenylpyruvate tautomerase PptA (4-oxalocrotonate tautomerase family)